VPVEGKLSGWALQSGAYFEELRAKCNCSSVQYVANAGGGGGRNANANAGGRVEVRSDENPCVRRAVVQLQARLEHQANLAAMEQKREHLAHDLHGYERELASGLRCEFEVPNEVLGLIIGKAGANVREWRKMALAVAVAVAAAAEQGAAAQRDAVRRGSSPLRPPQRRSPESAFWRGR
jgi:hypothetical protein